MSRGSGLVESHGKHTRTSHLGSMPSKGGRYDSNCDIVERESVCGVGVIVGEQAENRLRMLCFLGTVGLNKSVFRRASRGVSALHLIT